MEKMKQSDIAKVRDMLVSKQGGRCPICDKDLTRVNPTNVVIDHDHKTGVVRAALHRGCNKVEGSVLGTMSRWGKAPTLRLVIENMERLTAFWKLHQTNQTHLIYYNHKTATEKRLAINKKRRRLAAKKKKEA